MNNHKLDELDEKEVRKILENNDYFIKKFFFDRKFCMAYDKASCSGEIIHSHTISEKYIKSIARNNHVYTAIGSTHHKNCLYEFKEKGISRVSHINGFCSYLRIITFLNHLKKMILLESTSKYLIYHLEHCAENTSKKRAY